MPNTYNAQASTQMYRGRNRGTMAGLGVMSNGLKASRLGIAAASENGANLQTEGFARRGVMLRPDAVRGVITELCRMSDDLASNDLRKANSHTEYFRVANERLALLERNITTSNPGQAPDDAGEDTGMGDIGGSINALRLAFNALAINPDNVHDKQGVRSAVGALVGNIKRTYGMVETTETRLKVTVKDQVERINDLLQQVSNLNEKIFSAEASAKPAFALEDARDQALKELSGYIPIEVERTVLDVNGCPMHTFCVRLKSTAELSAGVVPTEIQRTLVDGRGRADAARFSVEPISGIVGFTHAGTIDAAGAVQPGQPVGGTDNGAVPVPGIPGFDFQNYLQRSFALGGSLSACLNTIHGLDNGAVGAGKADASFRNVSEYKGFLNTLAGTLIGQFNGANAAHGGGNLLAGVDATNIAITPAWLAAPAHLQTASVAAVTATMDTRHVALNTIDGQAHTFKEFFDAMVVGLGRDIGVLKANFDAENGRLEVAKDTLDSVSGISKEGEITDIGKFKAVFQFAQSMLQVQLQLIEMVATTLLKGV